jgi:hypothetical protein
MTIHYDDIKSWGRSFNEYVRMFNLTPEDLKRKIMDCGDVQQALTQNLQSEAELSSLLTQFTASVLTRLNRELMRLTMTLLTKLVKIRRSSSGRKSAQLMSSEELGCQP